ncbi:putative phage holin [Isoptericola sp. NPDC055881]
MIDERTAAALFAFTVWFAFWVTYTVLTKWWRYPEGRNVWSVSLALWIAFGIVAAAYLWPQYSIREWFVPVMFTVLGVLGLQRLWQLIARQVAARRENR